MNQRSPPPPEYPVQISSARNRSPYNFWLWKSEGMVAEWDRGFWEYQPDSRKGSVHRFTWTHSVWVLVLGQQLERHRDIQGRNELPGSKMRAGGSACSQTEVLPETIFFFAEPFPNRAQRQLYIRVFINLINFMGPTLVISWDPIPPNLWAQPGPFRWLFYTKGLSWLMLQNLLKSLEISQIPNKQHPQTSIICPQHAL